MPTSPPGLPVGLSTFAQVKPNGDGTVTQSLSLRPQYRRTTSGLVAVDPSVKASNDRSVPAAAEGALRPIRFGAEASQVARLDLDAGPVSLSAPGLRIGAPQVEPDGVVYRGVAADTDLAYRVSAGGLKEEVTLSSSASPTSFSFHLADPKGALGAARPTPGGGYVFANKVDDATVELPPPFAYEQKRAGADGSGAPRDLASASMTLTEAGDGWDLTVSVNPQWLAGKSFPVVLDPTVSFSNGNAFDGSYGYKPSLNPGCAGCYGVNGADPTNATGTYNDAVSDFQPARSAFRFNLDSIPVGSKVKAANLNLYIAGCLGSGANYYCDEHSYPVELHAFTAQWDANTATWNSLNATTAPGAFGGYTQPAFPGGTRQWAPPISMTGQVQSWVNGAANNGFALMLPYQPPNWGGPAYASAEDTAYPHPYLSVDYEATTPGTPGTVTASAANASAQVNWSPPSSNGGSPIDSYAVNVFDPDGSYTGIQVRVCGTCTSATIGGLANGRAYYFGVYAHNIVGYGTPGMSGFVTPAVPPGAPTSLQGSVSTGWYHSLIGRPDGTVAAFGLNNVGQLGNNTTVDARVPTAVPGLSGVVQVAAGYAHSLALKADGTVWAWGYNAYGNLGNNSTVQSNVPVKVAGLSGVVSVSTSFNHNLAVKSDGTVWAWGYNSNGQLGNNTTTQSTIPVKVPGLANIVSVSAGYAHSLTLRSDGGVFAFGLNNGGQLGSGTTVDSYAPIQVANVVSAVAVDAGLAHSVALRGDGAVWTWGYNAYGQLGNNSTVQANVAIVVPGLSGVTAVSAHGGYDTMARKADGTLWAWGYNADGQLGNNSTVQSNVPVLVPGLAGVTQVSAGLYHTLAATADGGLAAFGDNANGQLGNNTLVDARTPITPTGPGLAPQSPTLAAASPGRTVNVTWAAPALTGGRPITGYNLTLYKGTPGAGVSTATKTCPGPCTAAAFTDLAYSTTYHVTVAAVTAAGTGPAATSNPATSQAMATAGNGEGVIQWTPPTGGDPISGYVIKLFDTSGTTPVLVGSQTVAADQAGLLWTGLTNGTSYAFSIYTQTVNGDILHTTSGNITPDGTIPTSLLVPGTPVAQDMQDRQSTVTWAPAGLAVPATLGILGTTYTVRAFKDCDLTSAPVATTQAVQPTTGQPTATVTGLKNGTSYCFTAEATNLIILNSGQSPASNTVVPAGRPFAPVGVVARRGQQKASVFWSPPPVRPDGTPGNNGAEITGYTVAVYSTSVGPSPIRTIDLPALPTQVIVDGLQNGTSYSFTVRARNGASPDPSDESERSQEVTPAGAPFEPFSVVAVTFGRYQAKVSWSPPVARPDGTPGDNGDRIVQYRISASPPCPNCSGMNLGGDDRASNIVGLDPDTEYTFSVRAVNSFGPSAPTSATPVRTDPEPPPPPPPPPPSPPPAPNPPGAPSQVAVTIGNRQAAVTWVGQRTRRPLQGYR